MKPLLKPEELTELLLALLVFAHLPCAWWVLPAAFLMQKPVTDVRQQLRAAA